MLADALTQPRFRCVLPFEAVPEHIPVLRHVVSAQLGLWGLPAAVEETELVVTELATNVVKHVGERAPATLIVEGSVGRLRVEVHDQSRVLPRIRSLGCDAECGRGLHLLAGLAADWGAMPTGAGKVVWCEIPLDASTGCARMGRAIEALEQYRTSAWFEGVRCLGGDIALQEAAIELIADLLHWSAARGGDPDEVLDQAQRHYEAEAA
ncbi:ATP-binding protein [Streptomyces sp. MJP52]|uniref:ATP-binding protein n=1 Tax=Streptomyces sp. MJP52 TaxID=2940555 RepID=UPI002474F655|nr:ATP-binding protein [Streptomyces sp. MJP52]MDH6226808.1 anti-sigma regulatory factor (Ser/Thr protein kinase) [Streptomyces sp. MJP52]